MVFFVGMVPYGRLVCNGKAKGADEMAICGNKVGTLMKMESGKKLLLRMQLIHSKV